MLVLSRKILESIIITTPSGERIEIKLLASTGTRAKIGVACPLEWTVRRVEKEEERKS